MQSAGGAPADLPRRTSATLTALAKRIVELQDKQDQSLLWSLSSDDGDQSIARALAEANADIPNKEQALHLDGAPRASARAARFLQSFGSKREPAPWESVLVNRVQMVERYQAKKRVNDFDSAHNLRADIVHTLQTVGATLYKMAKAAELPVGDTSPEVFDPRFRPQTTAHLKLKSVQRAEDQSFRVPPPAALSYARQVAYSPASSDLLRLIGQTAHHQHLVREVQRKLSSFDDGFENLATADWSLAIDAISTTQAAGDAFTGKCERAIARVAFTMAERSADVVVYAEQDAALDELIELVPEAMHAARSKHADRAGCASSLVERAAALVADARQHGRAFSGADLSAGGPDAVR